MLPYVFANPGSASGASTARFAVSAAGNLRGPGRLPLVVDLENDPYRAGADCYGLDGRAMIGWIAGFAGQARALTGKWPVIYTAADWWRECTGSASRFRQGPAVAGRVRRHRALRAVHLAALDVLAVQQRRPPAGDLLGRPGLLPADRRPSRAPPAVTADGASERLSRRRSLAAHKAHLAHMAHLAHLRR